MNQSEKQIFLGIDGGQSHTEAIIADENGNILGGGLGGASNHSEIPGGRERLENAVRESVGAALAKAGLPPVGEIVFASAYCGMTGKAIYKEEIIRSIIQAEKLFVGHDAPTALFGATSGKAGVVVIAGTGSIIHGQNEVGDTARIGGLGYLFSDEGGGFWLAAQVIRLAIKEHDDLIPVCGLQPLVLEFFGKRQIREVTDDFYNGKISRGEIAKLARTAHLAAANGNEIICDQIRYGAEVLAASARKVAANLNLRGAFPVAGIGGMFRAPLMHQYFKQALAEKIPEAEFIKPRFGPATGALLLAYRQAGIEISEGLLNNLEERSEVRGQKGKSKQ